MKTAKSLGLALTLCLLLSGCFRMEQRVKVHDDGRVDIDQIIAANLDELSPESLGMSGGESLPHGASDMFCQGLREGASETVIDIPGRSIDDYKDGKYCGLKIRVELDAQPDHSDMLTTVFEQTTRLVQTANGWEFETTIAPEQLAAETGAAPAEIAQVLETAEIKLVLEMPGSAIDGEHNATSVSGGTFTWDIDPTGPGGRYYARTGPVTGLDKLPISPKVIGVILVNLMVIGGLAWFFLREEDQPEVATDMATGMATGMGSVTATPAATAAAAAPGTPYFDESYGIWMIDDPVRGLLWHREGTDEWVEF